MSRRTSEASKAIRAAWQKEQALVSEGKGTRDWTPEQQKEILELGKAYYHSEDPDDVNDGKAFEGHHMKSAEAYPEYQGDPENIQFLSRPEHQEAHGKDYRNPTNGYFNPVTKVTRDFGEGKYEACEIIELTNPIVQPANNLQGSSEKNDAPTEVDKEKSTGEKQEKNSSSLRKTGTPVNSTGEAPTHASKSFGEKILDALEAVKGFGGRHPILTGVLKIAGAAAVAVRTEAIANSGKGSDGGSRTATSTDYSSSFDDYTSPRGGNDYDDSPSIRDYPEERSSPEEHTVPAHGQHYHTKEGLVWKEKESYQRGGKHED